MPSAASTACAPSRCGPSMTGSGPTGRCGRIAWTPSNATSTPCPTILNRRNDMDADLGTLTPDGDRWRLAFTRVLAHPPAKVWRALPESGHVSQWFPSDIEGERVAGAKLRFPFRHAEGPTMDGEILVYDEPRVLALRWGDEDVRIELTPDGGRSPHGEMLVHDEPRVLALRWGDEDVRIELPPEGDGCRLVFVNTF